MNPRHQKPASARSLSSRLYSLLRMVVILSLLTIVLWGWRLLHDPHFMPIKNVKLVAPYQHIDQPTLAKIITPFVTDNGLFSIDVGNLKQALLQQPWVYSVVIKRIWPDQIEIDVTEQQAVAYWNNDALLNSQAEEFSPSPKSFPDGLPKLRGPEGKQQQVFAQLRDFNAALGVLNLSINELDLNSRDSWQLLLNNGIAIVLGRTDIEQRFDRFIAVYPKLFASNADKVANVDLRYPDGMAVKWRTPITKN